MFLIINTNIAEAIIALDGAHFYGYDTIKIFQFNIYLDNTIFLNTENHFGP